MIRPYQNSDWNQIMEIWLQTNIQAHRFIPEAYWRGHYDLVGELLPKAELYVYENSSSKQIEGFIGLDGQQIEGIFVTADSQSQGIGKQLLDFVKQSRPALTLQVYQKNKRAIRFYRREQFQIQAQQVDQTSGERELIMKWNASIIEISGKNSRF